MRNARGFLKAVEGLTTIEWVAIASVVLLAGLGITSMVLEGADELGGAVADQMEDAADDID
jgi:hypothetical protein